MRVGNRMYLRKKQSKENQKQKKITRSKKGTKKRVCTMINDQITKIWGNQLHPKSATVTIGWDGRDNLISFSFQRQYHHKYLNC